MKRTLNPSTALLCLFLTVVAAGAAPIVVTTSADSGPGSLRAAVAAAVTGDTITFDPALSGQTITLTTGEIAIKKAITITGPGAANLTISGNHVSRIFNVNINAVSTITDLSFINGLTSSDGGAIVASANLTLACNVFTGNQASINGGAAASRFGAAFNISDCTFSNNTSGFLSGALYTDGLNNSIARTTFTGNKVLNAGWAGALYNDGVLSIIRSTISNNLNVGKGGAAGGIYSDGTVTIVDSTISGNRADIGGVAGGFYNAGTVTFRNSTISGNSVGDAAGFFAAQGGGIFNEEGANVTVLDSTIANNSTGASGQGGGIYSDGNLTVHNSTIAGNTTGSGGTGGGIFSSLSPVTIANTIAARNNSTSAPDISGALTSQGFNLIGDTTGSTGEIATDMINVDPKLGPLQDNGAFTQTMALLLGSPAINHGNPAFDPNVFTPPLTTDQRGNPRMTGPIDIGAFEADLPHQPSIDDLSLPQTMECNSGGGQASVTALVSDDKGHSLTVQWYLNNELKRTDQVAGTTPVTKGNCVYSGNFPCGTTQVMVSVSDGQSDPVIQSTTVTVTDTTAPAISNISAAPNILWPPNHKMVAVKVNGLATDGCDPAPKCKIMSVTSNEPGADDVQITGDMTVNLRAERKGSGSGRIYTIRLQATDATGNSVNRDVTVSVPKAPK